MSCHIFNREQNSGPKAPQIGPGYGAPLPSPSYGAPSSAPSSGYQAPQLTSTFEQPTSGTTFGTGFQSGSSSGFDSGYQTTSSTNPFLSSSSISSSSSPNNYLGSTPVIGDVNQLTTINTGNSFGKANPVPVFDTAYPQTQNFGSPSSSSTISGSSGSFVTSGTSLGFPPAGFPSTNNHQSDSYGSPTGPIIGGQPSFSTFNGQSTTSVLNGQIVGSGNSGFQAVDSYGSPIAPSLTPLPTSASSGYGGPSAASFSNQPNNAAVAPSSGYGAPLAPVINGPPPPPPPSPTIQQPVSVYGTSPGPVIPPALAPQSNYGVPLGPVLGDPQSTPDPPPALFNPTALSYDAPTAGFDSGPSFEHPQVAPTLGAFIGSLDQNSPSYRSPASPEDQYFSPDTPPSSPPSLASTFLHAQDGYEGECGMWLVFPGNSDRGKDRKVV